MKPALLFSAFVLGGCLAVPLDGSAPDDPLTDVIDDSAGIETLPSADGESHLVVTGYGRDWTLFAGGGEVHPVEVWSLSGANRRTAFRPGEDTFAVASGTFEAPFDELVVSTVGGFVGSRVVREGRTGLGVDSERATASVCSFDVLGAARWCLDAGALRERAWASGIAVEEAGVLQAGRLWADPESDGVLVWLGVGPNEQPHWNLLVRSGRPRLTPALLLDRGTGVVSDAHPADVVRRWVGERWLPPADADRDASHEPRRVVREALETLAGLGASAPWDVALAIAREPRLDLQSRGSAALVMLAAERDGVSIPGARRAAEQLLSEARASDPDYHRGVVPSLQLALGWDLWSVEAADVAPYEWEAALAERLEAEPGWVDRARVEAPETPAQARLMTAALAVAGDGRDLGRIIELSGRAVWAVQPLRRVLVEQPSPAALMAALDSVPDPVDRAWAVSELADLCRTKACAEAILEPWGPENWPPAAAARLRSTPLQRVVWALGASPRTRGAVVDAAGRWPAVAAAVESQRNQDDWLLTWSPDLPAQHRPDEGRFVEVRGAAVLARGGDYAAPVGPAAEAGRALELRLDLPAEFPRPSSSPERVPAIVVGLVNATSEPWTVPATDGWLHLIQQAWFEGAWRDIEATPSSWCGNSPRRATLPPNHVREYRVVRYDGPLRTKLRLILRHWEGDVISAEFAGGIHPGQVLELVER